MVGIHMLIINLFSSSVNIFGCSWMFVVLLTVYFLLFMVDIGEHHGGTGGRTTYGWWFCVWFRAYIAGNVIFAITSV